jgi:hypothetical protein
MLRDGLIDEGKATTICGYCANLTPEQARQAERILFGLDDIETMTWGMIRDRIAKAVMEIDSDAARKRREDGRQDRRVEVRPEESGNAQVAARELAPDLAAAIDSELSARARELKKAGIGDGTGDRRVLALLEKFGLAGLSGGTSGNGTADGEDGHDGGTRTPDGGAGPRTGGNGPEGGACACGETNRVAAKIHLTAPAATLTDNSGRPGVLRGTGPVDADLTRDLADAAARNAETTYEFTITDPDGRAVAHGCGKPGPSDITRRSRKLGKPEKPDPPPGARLTGEPVLELIDWGPPGSYGTWRYTQHDREIIFEFEDLAGPATTATRPPRMTRDGT